MRSVSGDHDFDEYVDIVWLFIGDKTATRRLHKIITLRNFRPSVESSPKGEYYIATLAVTFSLEQSMSSSRAACYPLWALS